MTATELNGHMNGHAAGNRTPLRPGIYAPTLTFFDPTTEDLDLPTVRKHAIRLAQAGLVGLVAMGSNGEAVHLSRAERAAVTRATREALDEAGFTNVPVVVGTSEQSVRGTVELCTEAQQAGGEYALVVPPSYYRAAMDEEMIEKYFMAVADASPVPIILYNYPGAVAGIDMDSELMIRLGKHPNIMGTKFTCGNTGKLTRVASQLNAATPTSRGSGYMAFGGMADFIVQTLVSGGSGIIAGGANVMPKSCVKVWDLYSQGNRDEAIQRQKLLSKSDWVLTKTAIPGTKAALQGYFGYGGYARRPLRRLSKEKAKEVVAGIAEIMEFEKSDDYDCRRSATSICTAPRR